MAQAVFDEEKLTASRCMDVCEEPISQRLAPFTGFRDLPVQTIEESIKPIIHICNDIEMYVYIAQQGMMNPDDGLSVDESVSIQLFTMSFRSGVPLCQALNKALRTADRRILTPWLPYLKLFLPALEKLPSHKMVVWRGVRNVDMRLEYPDGKKFVWWGVSSCVAEVETLERDHILGKNGLRTLFCIECENGKLIGSHSYSGRAEEEVVLMPGFHFEVLDHLTLTNNLHIIRLRETASL